MPGKIDDIEINPNHPIDPDNPEGQCHQGKHDGIINQHPIQGEEKISHDPEGSQCDMEMADSIAGNEESQDNIRQ